jgi:hypothetical protein
MIINGTLNGESATIVDIDINGSTVYLSYIDAAGNLKVQKNYIDMTTSSAPFATSCSAVS